MITIRHDDDGAQPPNSWWMHKISGGRQQVITRCANGHIGSQRNVNAPQQPALWQG